MAISTLASPKTKTRVSGFVPRANRWVKLRDPVSEYSACEARLFCQDNEGRWVAWVPGHGEALLDREQLLQP